MGSTVSPVLVELPGIHHRNWVMPRRGQAKVSRPRPAYRDLQLRPCQAPLAFMNWSAARLDPGRIDPAVGLHVGDTPCLRGCGH